MQSERTVSPMDREQIQTPIAGSYEGMPTPPKPLSCCQRLFQQCVRPFVRRGQPRPLRLADCWDVQHEQVQPRTYDSPPDILARECGYNRRMAIYHMMLQA
jgi:hypothetical protein